VVVRRISLFRLLFADGVVAGDGRRFDYFAVSAVNAAFRTKPRLHPERQAAVFEIVPYRDILRCLFEMLTSVGSLHL
jgi:hypothetical protein